MREASEEEFLTKGGGGPPANLKLSLVCLFYDENNIFLNAGFPNCTWGRCFSSNLKCLFEGFPI